MRCFYVRFLCIVALILCLMGTFVSANSPLLISYQGNCEGCGISKDIQFSIYQFYDDNPGTANCPPTGTLLWTETHSAVTVDDKGLFKVMLGSATPFASTLFEDTLLWLSIVIDPAGTPEQICPINRLASVPFSLRVRTVDAATGGQIEGNVKITGNATIGAGSVNNSIGSFVAGEGNSVVGFWSSVVGGLGNVANGNWSAVGGGQNNVTGGEASTVGGGANNQASGNFSTISGGGGGATASGVYSTIAGGYSNESSGDTSTVSGGSQNRATHDLSTVSGGSSNWAASLGATVGGGVGNTAIGFYSTIAGGDSSTMAGNYSFVGGGYRADMLGEYSVIAGGHRNAIAADYAVVTGGDTNSVSGSSHYSIISGGLQNVIGGSERSIIVGGGLNEITNSNSAVIVGGSGNHILADATAGFIGGGLMNVAWGDRSFVGGGTQNNAGQYGGAIVGGEQNIIKAGQNSIIGGGWYNKDSSSFSVIGGGEYNIIRKHNSVIGGGASNEIHIPYGAILGGTGHTLWDNASKANVQGGSLASDSGSIIGGGLNNTGIGGLVTISGGESNTASNLYASIPGGFQNVAAGFSSFAAGYNSKAMHDGSFVWSDTTGDSTYTTGTGQFLIQASGGVGIGTNSPTADLHVAGDICYTGIIGACSDERFKKHIEPLSNALNSLHKLDGVKYKWRTDDFPDRRFDSREHIGFVAQQVKAVFPELILEGRDGYLSVDYGRLTPLLVEAIKELSRKTEVSDRENSDLREENTVLSDKLDRLERKIEYLLSTVNDLKQSNYLGMTDTDR